MNNDIEVINESWLTELVSQANRPGVGAVGCRLYYPDDHVQHDGIIIGMGGVAGYAHPHSKREDSGEFGNHHESVSGGPDTDPIKAKRFEREAVYMKNKWKLFIDDDPSYNPNLSLMEGYKIDLNRGQKWPSIEWLRTIL